VSSVNGGDLDWRPLEDFDPTFAAQIADLEIGQVTEPFRSEFGWHIAEVTGRRSFDMTEALREENCEDQIRERKVTEELEIWRRRLLDDAYVLRRM
jgi:peptidyl-prolyl cis-trans isomerase SurA